MSSAHSNNANEGDAVIVGEGDYRYKVIGDWAKIPDDWNLREVSDIAIDEQDRVYIHNRGEHPMAVFDTDGNLLSYWGKGQITNAHGLRFGPNDTFYLTDDFDHSIRIFTRDGKLLKTIGTPHQAAPFMSDKPFNRCCQVAFSPKGIMYVADGYGNACVHMYTPDGEYIRSWGQCGRGPGEFNVVHNICCDADGWLYVADRENHRIQVFDGEGTFQAEWSNVHRPCGLLMVGDRKPIFFVGELCPQIRTNHDYPNLGPRISVLDYQGNVLARIGSRKGFGLGDGEFLGPHGLAVDSKGDLYVGEVSIAQWNFFCSGQPMPEKLRCLRKLVRI